MSFGERLSHFRKTKKKTQQEVANVLGIPKTTYASYEQGNSEPNIKNLNKIADFYGISVDFLTGHNGAVIKNDFYNLGYELLTESEFIFLKEVLSSFRNNKK